MKWKLVFASGMMAGMVALLTFAMLMQVGWLSTGRRVLAAADINITLARLSLVAPTVNGSDAEQTLRERNRRLQEALQVAFQEEDVAAERIGGNTDDDAAATDRDGSGDEGETDDQPTRAVATATRARLILGTTLTEARRTATGIAPRATSTNAVRATEPARPEAPTDTAEPRPTLAAPRTAEPTRTPESRSGPSATNTPEPTRTPESRSGPSPSNTPEPTRTSAPTATRENRTGPSPSNTPAPTRTRAPSATPASGGSAPGSTPVPSPTRAPTATRVVTATPVPGPTQPATPTNPPTSTRAPTITPEPTETDEPDEPGATPRPTDTRSPTRPSEPTRTSEPSRTEEPTRTREPTRTPKPTSSLQSDVVIGASE